MARFLIIGFMAVALVATFRPSGADAAEEILVSGQFSGKSGHNTMGGVTVTKSGGILKVVLGADFRLDGAPDPKVGFGNSGAYDPNAQLSDLKSKSGSQDYSIPSSIHPQDYNQIYIWCERYSVPLGVAGIEWPEEEEGEKEAATD